MSYKYFSFEYSEANEENFNLLLEDLKKISPSDYERFLEDERVIPAFEKNENDLKNSVKILFPKVRTLHCFVILEEEHFNPEWKKQLKNWKEYSSEEEAKKILFIPKFCV